MFSLLLAAASIIAPMVMSQEKIINIALAPKNLVCDIEVKINEDLNRIPKQIKEIRCAREPTQWCTATGYNGAQCCHHRVKGYKMGCVELTDQLVVKYKDPEQSVLIDVAVGCSCGILNVTTAPAAPGPWRRTYDPSDLVGP